MRLEWQHSLDCLQLDCRHRSQTAKSKRANMIAMTRRRSTWLILGAALAVSIALAQRFGGRGGGFEREQNGDDDVLPPPRQAEFHFVRLEYTDLPQFHRRWGYSSRDGVGSGWWLVDWPAADNHFTSGIGRL